MGLPALKIESAPDAATAAGLRWVSPNEPGIRRLRRGKGWVYFAADGSRVTDRADLDRIRRIVIPPAWTDVWICPRADGHIQAIGRDARGRLQYRYHARWREIRDQTKFERLASFGAALPRIRAHVDRDLRLRGLPREKVLATVVRLLDLTFVRVGNEEYARANRSFGLTTLRNRHAAVCGRTVTLSFRGKTGKQLRIEIADATLATVVRRCQELPGQELFQYVDGDGRARSIDSCDVNQYLREAAGEPFTAKDFRTWAATVLAFACLRQETVCRSRTQANRVLRRAIESVSERLGNTPTICRKCYVHPRIAERWLEGTLARSPRRPLAAARRLAPDELATLALLRNR